MVTPDSLNTLLEREDVSSVIRSFSKNKFKQLTASEVFGNTPEMIGAKIGEKLGKALGLKVTDTLSFEVQHTQIKSIVACHMVMLKQDIEQLDCQLDHDNTSLYGDMPGNWAIFGGVIEVVITTAPPGCEITLNARIEGQLFAWGEGARRLKRFKTDVLAALGELSEIPM